MDSKALTKIQSTALIAVIVVAAVGGGAAYVFWKGNAPTAEAIKIGVCADIDNAIGKEVYQAVVLAVEQVNAQGGVLGKNLTVVAEDDDSETPPFDISVASNAMTKLITVDQADFVISNGGDRICLVHQDICADLKKIVFGTRSSLDNITQRVLDGYDRYKYFFRLWYTNNTIGAVIMVKDILTLANYTGFTKIAFLGQDSTSTKALLSGLNSSLPKYGLDIVYAGLVPLTITDFTSYFAAIEASGAEILFPAISSQAGISFVKEWYDRQSPCVVWGMLIAAIESNFWELTEGKCEYVSFGGMPVLAGYPLTNKTLETRESYLERWGTTIGSGMAVGAYDGVRFILPGAIRRAGTIETEAVIKALEAIDVETSMARHFIYTSSHDLFVGTEGTNNPEKDHVVVAVFQWQTNATLAIVAPEQLMKETNATYQYPPWQGPWSSKQPP